MTQEQIEAIGAAAWELEHAHMLAAYNDKFAEARGYVADAVERLKKVGLTSDDHTSPDN